VLGCFIAAALTQGQTLYDTMTPFLATMCY
jgi:hypothetical protein